MKLQAPAKHDSDVPRVVKRVVASPDGADSTTTPGSTRRTDVFDPLPSSPAPFDAAAFSVPLAQFPTHPKLAWVDDLEEGAYIAEVKKRLAAQGFDGPEVLIRRFAVRHDNIVRLIETGNDRDSESNLFAAVGQYYVGWDANPAVREAEGIAPDRLIFANRLRWKEDLPTVVYGGLREESGKPEQVHALSEILKSPMSVALYDPSKVRLAPDAEVEYWFDGPPEEALLMLLLPSQPAYEGAKGKALTDYIYEDVVASIADGPA